MAKKEKEEAKEEKEEKKDDKKEEKKGDKKEEKKGEGEEGAEGEGGEGAPKKSKKKIIIIGIAALVVLIGGAAGAYFAGLFGKSEEAAEEHKEGEKKAATKIYYNLPEFLVNLNSGSKQVSFLKVTVVLELESQLDVQPLEGDLPKLMDSFNTYLRELRASDLSGSAGIQRLREELLLRANKAVDPIKINDVLFKQIVVQ